MNTFQRGYETWAGTETRNAPNLNRPGTGPAVPPGLSGLSYVWDPDMDAYLFDLSGLGYPDYYYYQPADGLGGGFLSKVWRGVKKIAPIALTVGVLGGASALGVKGHTIAGKILGKGILPSVFGKKSSTAAPVATQMLAKPTAVSMPTGQAESYGSESGVVQAVAQAAAASRAAAPAQQSGGGLLGGSGNVLSQYMQMQLLSGVLGTKDSGTSGLIQNLLQAQSAQQQQQAILAALQGASAGTTDAERAAASARAQALADEATRRANEEAIRKDAEAKALQAEAISAAQRASVGQPAPSMSGTTVIAIAAVVAAVGVAAYRRFAKGGR